jgi:GGDEF domain-containing protein
MGIALPFTRVQPYLPPLLARLPAHLQPGVSTGMRLRPSKGMTFSHMMQRADEAMYRVKSSGKGRFALSSIY